MFENKTKNDRLKCQWSWNKQKVTLWFDDIEFMRVFVDAFQRMSIGETTVITISPKKDWVKPEEKEMKFEQLGVKERGLLLKALDFDKDNLVCELCNEKISYERCSIMPSLKTSKKQATILCESPLCLCEYLTIMEGEQREETIEGNIIPLNMVKARVFVRHIENHLRASDVVCCKICGKTIDHIFEEEGVVKS